MNRRKLRARLLSAAAAGVLALTGCTTVAEHRKLERQLIDIQREKQNTGTDERRGAANLTLEIEELRGELRRIRGRLDIAEKTARDALREARKARQEVAALPAPTAVTGAVEPDPALRAAAGAEAAGERVSAELLAYREAYGARRAGDQPACIDRFRNFLQTYPASPYADDAAFWMADCHFKQGDYKNAVLRFDDVVRNYPTGNKAPDALYRQGESLLKLGPGFHEAAKRAFERVLTEYPDSARAREANRQLELIGVG